MLCLGALFAFALGCGGPTALGTGSAPATDEAGGNDSRSLQGGNDGSADADTGHDWAPDLEPHDTPALGSDQGVADVADAAIDFLLDLGSDRGREGEKDATNEVASEVRTPSLELLAGGLGGPGSADGIGTAARFYRPDGLASDGAGHLFVVDGTNHTIRQVVIATGQVTTLAGAVQVSESLDGAGANAHFFAPGGIASDGAGRLFVADGNAIRQVVVTTGEVTTLAGSPGNDGSVDGIGSAARFYAPWGLAYDGAGNLFVADYTNHGVRKVVVATGEVTSSGASFTTPRGLADDGAGHLLVSDDETIRKLDIAADEVTILAGSPGESGSQDGVGYAARFHLPFGVASDGAGNLFVSDFGNATIRKLVVATGEVTTLAGSPGNDGSSDGLGDAARFHAPIGIATDGAGDLFISDNYSAIRKIVIATGAVTTFAGSTPQPGTDNGTGAAARFNAPADMVSDGLGNLFVSDSGNDTIRKIVIATGEVTTLAGSSGNPGSADGIATAAQFSHPVGITSDGAGNLFVADSGNGTVRQIVIATGKVTTLYGQPTEGTSYSIYNFGSPTGVVSDGAGNLYVSDTTDGTILKIVIATGGVSILAGSPGNQGVVDGKGSAAQFNYPGRLASDGAGNLFVSDEDGRRIRQIVIATGEVTTVNDIDPATGVASNATVFRGISGLACDRAGNLFVADVSRTVRRIALATSVITTVVGKDSDYSLGVQLGPLPAALTWPNGLAFGPQGELFITDGAEHAVLVVRF